MLLARAAVGVHVAVLVVELYENVVAMTLLLESFRVKTIELGVTASLKVAVTVVLVATLVAPEVGVCDTTVGTTAAAVVNDHETGAARELLLASVAALIVAV